MKALLLVLIAIVQIARTGIEGFVGKAGALAPEALTNARVELLDGPSLQAVRTDGGGRFSFNDLLPGNYRILVTRDGFIRQEYGPIELKPGTRVQDVEFLLQSAPTIAGWVRDEYGEPLPNALIQAWRKGYDPQGKRMVVPFASTLTDERGFYRLFWLDPGEYIVSGRSSAESTNGFFTYYPGFADPADAEAVQLRAGREVGGVDFKTDRGTLVMVGGSVLDGVTRRPIAARVTLTVPGEANSPIRHQGQTDAKGVFAIDGVAPGTYIVLGTAGDYRGFTTIVVARNRNYPNGRLELWPSLELHGNILAEPGAALDLRQTRIAMTSIEPALPSPAATGVRVDRSFSITSVSPGTYGMAVTGLPDDAYIKVVGYGQKAVLDGSIEIEAGAVPQQLQILLGMDGGRIRGTTVDSSGHPQIGAQVILVPEGDRRGRPEQYKVVQSDLHGMFTIRGVSPGDYKLFGWETLEPYAYLNPDFIRNYEDRGSPLRITPNARISSQVQTIPKEDF